MNAKPALAAQDASASPAPAPQSADGGIPVYLLVTINGNASPDLAEMTDHGGHLTISPQGARQLGFSDAYLKTIPAGTPLDAYPGLKVDYNQGQQSVAITAPFSTLDLRTETLGQGGGRKTRASASPGLLLNYDLYATDTLKQASAMSGFTELRAFSGLGVASTDYLTQALHTEGDPQWTRTTVRLDTSLEHSFQDQETTLRLGDTLTRGLPWTRQTRIGGLQIGSDFSLQPYQTTAPLPAYFGTAALPSSVQLYINGIQQYSGNTPAGPFNLYFQPSVNGAGQAQVVMTDALGRSTVVNFPFYATSTLLRQGLTDWSFESGYVRQNYGYQSFDYGTDPMGSGVLRYGLTRNLTLEGHAEGSRNVGMGGLGATAALGTWGVLSGSWAASRSSADTLTPSAAISLQPAPAAAARGPLQGSQFSLGYQLQRHTFSMGASTQQATENFRDVASAYGSTPILRSDNAYANVTVNPLGNFGVNYVKLRQLDQPASRYGGVSWSRGLTHGATIALSYSQNLNDPSDRTVTLNLTFNLDHGFSSYASSTRSRDGRNDTVGASGSTGGNGGGWNWNVRGQQNTPSDDRTTAMTSGAGQISRRTQYADVNVGVNAIGNTTNVYGGATGSLVAMGDGIFASRRIDDAFAVVSTDGVGHVPVRYENRPVGQTNGRGLLLVPDLLSYQNNKIGIDPTKLPLNMHIDQTQMNVVPQHASGLNVVFKMQRVQAASLTLHQPDGKAVPLGAAAYLNGGTKPSGWVGYDGQLYLEGLKAENDLVLKNADSSQCTVHFPFKAVPDTLPEIGPLACTP
jgi:outer membrane usher protein